MIGSRRLSKSGFRDGRKCAKRLYLRWTEPRAPLDEAAIFQMENAERIRSYARNLIPHGIAVTARYPEEQAEQTEELLRSGVDAIHDPTFVTERLTAQAQSLFRRADGFRLRLVKSGKSLKPEYIEEAAFATLVARESGVAVAGAEILTLADGITWDDLQFPERLFQIHDVSQEVEGCLATLASEIEELFRQIDSGAAELVPPSRRCDKDCPYYEPCFADVPDDSLIFLPRLSGKKLQEVEEKQFRVVADLPDDFPLSPTQVPFCELFRSGGEFWSSPDLVPEVDRIRFPAVFIDFETCRPALPLSPNCPAGQQLLFQWSAHVMVDPHQPPVHYDFVDLVSEEPHSEGLSQLLPILQSAASVLHWSSAEKSTLNGITCPDQSLLDEVKQLFAQKSIDLEKIVRDNLVLPKFRGRSSLKIVLAAIQPEAYKDLAIANGRVAEMVYVRARLGQLPPEELERQRENLLEYCRQDTLALVDIFRALQQYAQPKMMVGAEGLEPPTSSV